MGLIQEKPTASFDLNKIRRGCLLWGKHSSWTEGKAGFVTAAMENQLIVQYAPRIGNVTNHFHIPVSEAAAGQWEIRWSMDLSEVHEYGINSENGMIPPEEPEHLEEEESKVDREGNCDTGGIDL